MTSSTADRNRRADAQRNRAAIIDAALTCLAGNPRASMTEIAQAAKVGRVTLYGHFSSRTELIEAAAEHTIDRAEAQLAPLDFSGDAKEALDLLVTSSWQIINDSRGLLAAAEQQLGTERIREHHAQIMLRLHRLIERGQAEASFRSDQPAQWLTASIVAILHGAATEIREGRLSEGTAARVIPETVHALVAHPATPPACAD